MRCAVVGCNSDNQSKRNPCKNIKFHSFPQDPNLSKKWLHLTKRKDKVNIKSARVCSKHFCESAYKINLKHTLLGYTPKSYRALKDDAIPTENLPKPLSSPGRSTSVAVEKQKSAYEKRQRTQLIRDITKDRIQTNEKNEGLDNLKHKLLLVTRENENLKSQIMGVKKVFSENQIKKLENHKRITWSVSEISNAISMYAAGPRAYRLSLKRGFPYPAVSTLKQWLRKIKLDPGILKNAIKITEFVDMTENDRVCTIVFDEMKVRTEYLYDQTKDCIMKPYDYVQVVLIRGIFKSWMQPVFYNFDCKMTSDILMGIIKFVEESGFHVVAMVSDLGANRGLHNELNVSNTKPYFTNPSNNEKIFVMADIPQLLKLIRNNFVAHGFLINNKPIKKEIVEQTINATSGSDLKITIDQLNVTGPQRQRVKYAAKLFSHTMSSAISRCGTLGILTAENWVECAEFFKLVNDWFDVFNISIPETDFHTLNKGYGLALEEQNTILNKMTEAITELKVIGSRISLPFQKGILLSNSALKMLLEDLKRRFSIQYLLTRRLNQDVIENFFGVIRAKGGLHGHPSPLEFKYRIRSYILGRNKGAYSEYCIVNLDDTPDISLTASLTNKLNAPEVSADYNEEVLVEEIDKLKYDGLDYLASFVCQKLQDESLKSSSNETYSWIDHLSESGLSKPSTAFMNQIRKLDKNYQEAIQ
ncbi:unnamed protein product [Acanthoscelides obtectus]|uniref:THAP-type domain-containing protein n=1 Tax=Acanthoscelides obtectus TaxID=200917 RepID=A0A9P0JKK7_ACAOB|nr:unnamed protein product [Acanthoscelides obtectus]CAK1672974.1 Transposable element P transposase [Acanthoscelides obtectus]